MRTFTLRRAAFTGAEGWGTYRQRVGKEMEAGFPADQAVRIFIEFDRIESATKALVDLEGRFFGGRTVRATFFDQDKFERAELAPIEGEQM